MVGVSFTCARCLYSGVIEPGARFCPRCGMQRVEGDPARPADTPIDITTKRHAYRAFESIAIGEVSSVYRCTFALDGRDVEAVLKIARDPVANDLLRNEAAVLTRLHAGDPDRRFEPFLPIVEESFAYQDDPASAPRQVNVLRAHPEIRSPADELYTLVEVRRHYPQGLDPRDMAWIWRRLLSILGFAHSQAVVHGAVLPPHVLIEPREHKLMLIDWCWAAVEPPPYQTFHPPAGGFGPWYDGAFGPQRAMTSGLDVSLGARCMLELMGGDAVKAVPPPNLDPALRRYFDRASSCGASARREEAWKALEDFDRLIETLWGPRRFRALTLPPRRSRSSDALH